LAREEAGSTALHPKEPANPRQQHLVLVAAAVAGEEEPVAVGRPAAVGVAPRGVRQPPQAGAVRPDDVEVERARAVAREGDAVPVRRPGRKVVVVSPVGEGLDPARLDVDDPQMFDDPVGAEALRGAVDDAAAIFRS
jgi:hypothetical protein